MSKKIAEAAIIPTLLVSLCTSAQGLTNNTSENIDTFQNEKSLFEINHIKIETVQLLALQNDPGSLMINVAGDPGVHFQVYFSSTGQEDSYKLINDGQAVIGKNSFVSLIVDIKSLGYNKIFLNMFSNDDGDFTKIGRKISQPIVISLTNNRVYIANADTNSTDNNSTKGNSKGGRAAMGIRG